MAARRLVVNADDFGFTRDVNEGIIEGHRSGILTAATIMANGAAFEDAAARARENPALDVGCHLVLVGGPGQPASVGALARAIAFRRLNVHAELERQVERALAAGLAPTHLDTHKHTHLLPPVLDAVARLGEEYGIRWIRRPFDLPFSGRPAPWAVRAVSRCLGVVRGSFHRKLASHGCRTTDHFAGFQLTGRLRTADLVALIRSLPEGTTEFMCHPGRCGPELRSARTRLKESREWELEALTAGETRRALEEAGVQLTCYRDLS